MYNRHYGLSALPFQLTPDPHFWFESRTHKKAMSYLGYGLAQGEGFIVITGDIGAGKTTLVGHLLETIDRNRFTTVHITSTQLDADDMLRLIAQRLGLSTEGVAKAQIIDRLERLLDEQLRGGRHVLIIVDEAQNLPMAALEELRLFSNYQVGGRAMVQVLLLGQPEFRAQLGAAPGLEQLRQRVIATHHLDAMTAEEVEPYIYHRLGQVGYHGKPEFKPDCFDALYAATGGIPRLINSLMARVMLHGALESAGTISGAAVAMVAEEARVDSIVSSQPALTAEIAAVYEERIANLETRVDNQDTIVRRILTLLVGWVENDSRATRQRAPRTDAA